MNARTILLALACLALELPAAAQSASARPLTRADAHGAVSWGHVHFQEAAQWDQWDHRVAHASATLGWYWSDHLKTEIEVDTASKATFYRYQYVAAPDQNTYRGSTLEVRGTSVGAVQHYQFLRNAWVHPFIGAGLEVRHEQRAEQVEPMVVYQGAGRESWVLEPGRRIEWPDQWRARAVAEAGVKTYVSQRAFARFGVKVALRDGVEDVALRIGIGADF
jgi:hypothetical protein